jgi:hypothetical protein
MLLSEVAGNAVAVVERLAAMTWRLCVANRRRFVNATEMFCVTACWSRVSPLVKDRQIGLLTFIHHSALI